MDRVRAACLLLGLASLALLAGALAFQYWGGLPPCELCMWQRYAHGTTLALGLAGAAIPRIGRTVLGLLAVGFLAGAGIAVFHVGVEQGWWQGTTACGTLTPAATIEDLRLRLQEAPLVRCNEVLWSLAGISMAGYNVLISLGLAGVALWRARNPNP